VITVLSLLLSACGPLDDQGGKSNHGKGNDKENNKDKDKDKNVNADKITICHKTGSAKNPYVEIRVSKNAIKNGHGAHEGDLIPAPEGGCPETVAADVPAK
jgi:major membrane immunogen (membrane-anchored lipoprotein)